MKVITKSIELKGTNYNYIVTIRSKYYANLKNPSWGKNDYAVKFAHSGESFGAAKMSKQGLLGNIKTIESAPAGMFN